MHAESAEITKKVKFHFLNLFDEKIGIVMNIQESQHALHLPLYCYYASTTFDRQSGSSGGGVALDRETALSKAIGECLERYCLSSYENKLFVQTRPNDENNRYPCVSPEKVELYTPEELKHLSFQHYHDSFETLFCAGYNVTKRAHQYLPLPLVYLRSCFFDRYPEQLKIIQQTISTGAAFGVNFYQTALSGIYEVIERDAMMAFWLLGQQVPRIEKESLAAPQKMLVDSIEKNDVEVFLFDISLNDQLFVILSCLKTQNSMMPAVVFSAAAHHHSDAAIQKALEEGLATFGLAENLLSKHQGLHLPFLEPLNWKDTVCERDHHVLFWSYHQIFDQFKSHLDFIFKSTESISCQELMKRNKNFPDSRSAFFSIVDHLAKEEYETLLVDISSSDIRALGFMVLKAIIPGYLPLHLGHRFAYSKPKRLQRIAKSKYELRAHEIVLNQTPHPYP